MIFKMNYNLCQIRTNNKWFLPRSIVLQNKYDNNFQEAHLISEFKLIISSFYQINFIISFNKKWKTRGFNSAKSRDFNEKRE